MHQTGLTYHISHSVLYPYNDLEFNVRSVVVLYALAGVTWHDIVREANCKNPQST